MGTLVIELLHFLPLLIVWLGAWLWTGDTRKANDAAKDLENAIKEIQKIKE